MVSEPTLESVEPSLNLDSVNWLWLGLGRDLPSTRKPAFLVDARDFQSRRRQLAPYVGNRVLVLDLHHDCNWKWRTDAMWRSEKTCSTDFQASDLISESMNSVARCLTDCA